MSRHNSILQKLDIRNKVKLEETIKSCKLEFAKENSILQNKLFQYKKEIAILKENLSL